MRFDDIIIFTFKNISHRGLRSWLTVIGIVIGITAVVTLITLGDGLKSTILDTIGSLSSDTIFIFKGTNLFTMGSPAGGTTTEQPLTLNDLKSIERIQGVKVVAPFYAKEVEMRFNSEIVSTPIYGTNQNLDEAFKMELKSGRHLTNSDTKSIVLGKFTAEDLFDREIRVNDNILLNNKTYRVIGILKSFGTSEQDDMGLYVNWKELEKITDTFDEEDDLLQIIAKVYQGYDIQLVQKNIEEVLRQNHKVLRGEEDFTVMSYDTLQELVGGIFNALTAFVSGIAAISLLVSGIGIANTMFMSVMERTREIGIMKAIGAENRTVMYLFIAESAILGLVGGLIGTGLGFGIALLVSIFLGVSVSFSISLVIFVLVFSITTGTIAGLIPARRAAKLNTIDALRYE